MALVQHRSAAIGSGASSASLALISAAALNNRVIAAVGIFPNTTTITSVTDNATTPNSYHADNSGSNATIGDTVDIRSANVASNPSSGNLQVTVSFSSVVTGGDIFAQEISGSSTAANAVDQIGSTLNTGTPTAESVSLGANSAAAGEYVFGLSVAAGVPGSYTAGASTTLDDSDTTNGAAACHRTGDSAGGALETLNLTTSAASAYLFLSVAYLKAAAAVVQPQRARGRTVPLVQARRGRAATARVAAIATPPTGQRERLVVSPPAQRGRIRIASPAAPAARPVVQRERLVPVSIVPRARPAVARTGSPSPNPVLTRGHPPAVLLVPRSRAILVPVIAVGGPLGVRSVLGPLLVSPRARASLATFGGPVAVPPVAMRRQVLVVVSRRTVSQPAVVAVFVAPIVSDNGPSWKWASLRSL
jgi:hypothetical protein